MSTDSGALVLKRSKAIGAEVFCTCLALKLGIRSPLVSEMFPKLLSVFFFFFVASITRNHRQMRIVATNENYGIVMLTTLVAKDPIGRVRATLYEQNFLLLMQYQRGACATRLFFFSFFSFLIADSMLGFLYAQFDCMLNFKINWFSTLVSLSLSRAPKAAAWAR